MAKVIACIKCRQKAAMFEPVKFFLKYCDPDNSDKDVWVCEHMLRMVGEDEQISNRQSF